MSTIKLIIFLFLSLNITACMQDNKMQQTVDIKQNKDDLLANTSSAVCYSGYRSGQHPDVEMEPTIPHTRKYWKTSKYFPMVPILNLSVCMIVVKTLKWC